MLRSTILVDDPNTKLQSILESFEKRGYKVWNDDITNRYTDGSSGYKDIAIKFTTGDGDNVVKELQIMTPNMQKAKYELGGHDLYNKRRTLNVIDPETRQQAKLLDEQMAKLYNDAYEADLAAMKASSEISSPSNTASRGGKVLPSESTATTEPSGLSDTFTNTPSTEKNFGKLSNRLMEPPFDSSVSQNTKNVNPDLMYGESALANRTSAQSKGNMLQRLGEVMEGAQSNTTRVQNRKLGIKSAGNAIDKVYKKTGISDLDVQTELAKELTGGANSYLDEIQRTALSATEDGTQRTVDTSPIVAKIESLVDDKISETNLSGSKRQQFISSLKRDVQKGDTITAANRLKEQAQVLLDKKENMKPLDKQQAKVYRELAQDLDDLSYSAVPKDNVDAMFETAISESRGRAAQAKKVGNQQIATAYEKIASGLEELPRTIQAFRSFKKDFVDVAKMGELSAQGEQAVLAQNGANITGNLKRFVNKTLQKPTNQALAWAGSKLSDAGEKMASSTPAAPNAGQTTETLPGTMLPVDRLGNAIGRAEGARAAGNSLEAQLANMNTNEALQTTQNGLNGAYYTGSDVYGNTTTPSYSTGAGAYNQGNDYLSRIEIGIQNAFNAGDFESVEYLIDMYNTVSKMYQAEEPKQTKLTATQQRANAAATSLQRLANMTPDTGYAVSGIPIIGNLATLGGNSYLSEAQSLAQQIGYMVSGANIKKEEAEAIGRAYVPQPFDSEQIRNEKLQRAAEIIRMYQNGYTEE